MKQTMRTEMVQPSIDQHCNPQVKEALLRAFSRATSQHSLTSRRFSMPALLRDEVDTELARYLASYPFHWRSELLKDFRPSKMWSTHPGKILPTWPAATPSAADRAMRCAEAWRSCLREAARSVESIDQDAQHLPVFLTTSPPIRTAIQWQLVGTLDTLMYLTDVSVKFLPRRSKHQGTNVGYVPLQRRRTKSSPYCEMCWRVSEFFDSEELSPSRFGLIAPVEVDGQIFQPRFAQPPEAYSKAREVSVTSASTRFCRLHNPQGMGVRALSSAGLATSRGADYRRDVRYREGFQAELGRLRRLRLGVYDRHEQTLFALRPDDSAIAGARLYVVPHSGLEVDLRRAAYTQARFGLNDAQEAIWILADRGLSTAQIAEFIGMTPGGVRNTLYKLRTSNRFNLIRHFRDGSGTLPLWE